MITIQKTDEKDLDRIEELFTQAKQFLKQHHINQWQTEIPTGYPSRNEVKQDIQKDGAYSLMHGDKVIGYSFIQNIDDPTYHKIDNGKWLNEEPYVVIHRTCIDTSYKGKGLSSIFVIKAKEICADKNLHSIRVDTHPDNIYMQKMLEKNGFIKCGIIHVYDGTERYAYQLLV